MASFKSFLSAVGHDFEAAFKWLGSSQGQATIAGGEAIVNTVVSTINPALVAGLSGVEALFNAGLKQVLSMEASAAAVGAQAGTGVQKSAAVVAALTPQVQALLLSIGVKNATAEQIQGVATSLSNGVATVLNSIPNPAAS